MENSRVESTERKQQSRAEVKIQRGIFLRD